MAQGVDRRKFLLRSLAAAAAGPTVLPYAEFERRYKEDGPIWLSIVRELGVTLD